MSNLKENLLKVIDSALELAAECEQTIEVRGAVKQLKQAHGSISMHTDNALSGSQTLQGSPDQKPEESESGVSESNVNNIEVNDAQEIHGEKAPESDLDLTDPA